VTTEEPEGLITSVPDATIRRSELADPEKIEFTVRRERVLPPPPPRRPDPTPLMATVVEPVLADAQPDPEPRPTTATPPARGSRRRRIAILSTGATVAAAGAVVLIVSHDSGKAPAAKAAMAATTSAGGVSSPALPAELTPTVAVACVGTRCQFTLKQDARFGNAALRWTFGDGTTQTGAAAIAHAYRATGSYTVAVAVDLPGGTTRSAPVAVRLTSWRRAVRLRAGRAGSRELTAVLSAPVGCRIGSYQLVRLGAARRVVAHGRLGSNSWRLTAPAAGRYRLELLPAARAGGVCAAATSATATVRPRPTRSGSGTSAPPATTPTQRAAPPPTHYTPPAPR